MADLFPLAQRWMDDELVMFDESVSRFLRDRMPAERLCRWRDDGIVERAAWTEMAEAGLLGLSVPAEYGGGGGISATKPFLSGISA